ncbi:MAG: hypothetical protein ACK5VF_03475 [Bacteroidota bacterium]|jgi:hypothetical protein
MSKELRDSLRTLIKPNGNAYSKVCTVDSVDLVNLTCYCIPINDDADITEVRLMANIDNGFLLIPEVNSIVVVSFLSDSSAYVSLVSKVSEIQLNGTNYDGLVKVQELTDKLNNLENKLNDLITACSSQVVTLAPSGTFPLASFFTSVTPLIPTQQIEIENQKVKQGDGS